VLIAITNSGYIQANLDGLVDNNIICIDYGPLAKWAELLHKLLGRETSLIGNRVAYQTIVLFKNLFDLNVITSFQEVHIIAHSLGSHVAGIIGWNIQLKWGSSRKIGRIRGENL